MVAGGEPQARRRQRPLGVSEKPACTLRRAALNARALRGAGGSLGGGGTGRTARFSNGRAPWPARGGATLPRAGSSRRPPAPLLRLSLPPRSAPPRFPALAFLPPGLRRSGARRRWSQVAWPGQPAPSLSGEKCSQISRLPFLPFFQLSLRPWPPPHQAEKRTHKEHGIWIYKGCGFTSWLCDLEQIAQPLGVGFLIRKETWED